MPNMMTWGALGAGYAWIYATGRRLGAPYGGWKQSGIGQEECFDERLLRPGEKRRHALVA